MRTLEKTIQLFLDNAEDGNTIYVWDWLWGGFLEFNRRPVASI
jgi:hypothetical protein